MKTALKMLVGFSLLAIVLWISYNHFHSWQRQQDSIEAAQAPQGKLPSAVEPRHYQLKLRIDPDEDGFSGQVSIEVEINEPVEHIWLHGKSITAKSAQLLKENGQRIALDYHEMGRSGVVRLMAPELISPQHAVIEIVFEADFNSKLNGLYRVEEGAINYAFTQFEAIAARRAFPSFDEPRFKTPFDITLEVQESHKAFANTPVLKITDLSGGFKSLQFATTKPLPTYLIAFAVGELDVVEYASIPANAIRDREVPLRGIATKGKSDKLGYALANTAAILTTLEGYFGSAYPYQKLDIVAVPDFGSGAMENAGLITYKETLLLVGDNPSVEQKRAFAYVHAHELAHQWFGNLVTMPWWNDLWLNESFATWMGLKAVHQWDKSFEFDREIVKRGHGVMAQDVFLDTRQIREPVDGDDDIANVFDGISYSKGGAVLQMLESTLSPAIFQKGVQYHIQKFAFGNASADDLVQSLIAVSGSEQLADITTSFLTQPGVPVLGLQWQCADSVVQVDLTQSRYLPFGSSLSPDQRWVLPVCLTLIGSADKEQKKICRTLSQSQTNFELEASCPVAIMPNSDAQGYYRWSVSKENWQALLSHLDQLNSAEKYSVASNLAAEFRAGRLSVNDYLEAISAIIKQPEWDLIIQPIAQLEYISDYITPVQEKAELASYVYSLYKPVLDELGYKASTAADTDKPVATTLLRKRILGLMALRLQQAEQLGTLAELGRQAIGYGTDQQLHLEKIDPDLLFLVLASAVQVEGEPYFDKLLESLKLSNDASFRSKALWALGSTTDPELSNKVLDLRLMLSLKLNEMPSLIESHMSRVENQAAIYRWVKRYYAILALALPDQYVANAPLVVAEFCTDDAYQDAKAFFTPKSETVPGMKRNLSQSLEKIELCSALVAQQQKEAVGLH